MRDHPPRQRASIARLPGFSLPTPSGFLDAATALPSSFIDICRAHGVHLPARGMGFRAQDMQQAIHQLVAGFARGDAISNEALTLRARFRAWGASSDIFSEAKRILPELRGEAVDVAEAAARIGPDDIAILHLSIGSPVNEVFTQLNCRKAILYHNVTPPHYFAGLQEQIARQLEGGLRDARALAGAADVNYACSRYNASEMEAMGYRNVGVLPLVLDLGTLRGTPNRATLKRYRDGLVNVLFVGRCAPNKRIEDLLHAFYYFQRYIEPASRLIHVGSHAGTEQYHALLLTLQHDLGLRDVEMVGAVRQDELNACYQAARVFLCMSEHEGFGIPLVESMVNDVPVMAFDAGAVAETMDGAGILFREKRFDLVAEMMGRVAREGALREAVLRGQRERIARFEARDLDAELKAMLMPLR